MAVFPQALCSKSVTQQPPLAPNWLTDHWYSNTDIYAFHHCQAATRTHTQFHILWRCLSVHWYNMAYIQNRYRPKVQKRPWLKCFYFAFYYFLIRNYISRITIWTKVQNFFVYDLPPCCFNDGNTQAWTSEVCAKPDDPYYPRVILKV